MNNHKDKGSFALRTILHLQVEADFGNENKRTKKSIKQMTLEVKLLDFRQVFCLTWRKGYDQT